MGRSTPAGPLESPPLRLRGWAASWRPYAADIAVALALALISVAALAGSERSAGTRDPDLVAYALALMLTVPLALRRRWPLTVFLEIVVGVMAYDAAGYPAVNVDFFGPVLALYTVAAFRERRVSLLAAGLLIAAFIVLLAVVELPASDGSVLTSAVIIVGTWLLGDSARQRREAAEVLSQQAADLRQARADMAAQAVTQERLRIARELHDVVAHHMSAVVVQSAVALDRFESDPGASRRAMAHVEALGRSALREMRGILGVLRDGDAAQGALTPTPGLADIEALCAGMRAGGLDVVLEVRGAGDVPLPAGLAAYRVAQEGLTNVLKHAPRNRATVTVVRREGVIEVGVRDSGRPPSGAESRTGGVGIAGMRERVTLLGGSFDAHATADGFDVIASIPTVEA